jgi:hypothetical protein
MELILDQPKPRYGVITLTLPGHNTKFLDLGPVLVASYNRQEFEVLYPFRLVVTPLEWTLIETYGVLDSPDAALWRYMKDKEAAENVLAQDFDAIYSGGAVALEIPRRKVPAVMELITREVGR